jgi:hemerythrin
MKIDRLTPEEQFVFLNLQFEKKGAIKIFLEMLKNYSLLHFETSESYMKNYLAFEFMPGRYLGNVTV